MNPKLYYEVLAQHTPGEHNDVCLLSDLTGNGWLDVIIGGKRGEGNLCWYEAPDWTCHSVSQAYLEAGGALLDINGNGRLDIIAGEAGGGHELYWFEQPADPRDPWQRHLIENGFHKYHDQAIGDVDGDGEPEILIASQCAGIVAYYDIPDDLNVRRWPFETRHIVYAGLEVEGLAIGDVDGDGVNEIVAGTNIFHRPTDPCLLWERQELAQFVKTGIALGDLTGDGIPEIVAAEGESYPGRLAWFDREGHQHLLADNLFHPHSLAVADLTGNGALDIMVGEMGLGQCENPRLIVYANDGAAHFEKLIAAEGVPMHNAQVGDVNGNGRLDIVSKPYNPGNWVNIWWNRG